VDKFIALLFSGVAYGAILALLNIGFLVLYRATNVFNFAYGDLVTLGGYLGLWALIDLEVAMGVAFGMVMVAMAGVGVVIERVAYAPLRRRPPMVVAIATLAAGIAIRGGLAAWQGSDAKRVPGVFGNKTINIAGAAIDRQRVLIIVVTAVIVTAMWYLVQRTSFGRRVRALATDPETVRLCGVRTWPVTMAAFALSTSLAGLAGLLVAPLGFIDLNYGFALMLSAFAAMVLGGFGSFGGVIVGSLLIGLAQQMVGGYVFTGWAPIFPYIVLLLVIGLRPAGLFNMQRARL
jgi:branched-chain amino acid transport system permease protein